MTGMRTRILLYAGLTLLAVSVIGPAVQGSAGGSQGWWDGHMFGAGHMSWWSSLPSSNVRVEGGPELVVTATDFAFSPTELTVEVGEGFNLTLLNEGAIPHDLVIEDLGFRLSAAPGQQVSAGLTVDTPGSFDILCTYPGHADSGMTGVLIVQDST